MGLPSGSNAQLSGIVLLSLLAFMISLFAITLALWSIKNPESPGTDNDQGFVPTTGTEPPLGAIEAGALVMPRPIKP